MERKKTDHIDVIVAQTIHDLNNILTGIQATAGKLVFGLSGNNELSVCAQTVLGGCKRAAMLTTDLMNIIKNQQKIFRCLKLHDCVQDTVSLLKNMCSSDVSISAECQAADDCVCGDAGRVQSLLLNLGINARDAMPEGGSLTIRTRNCDLEEGALDGALLPCHTGRYVMVEVADTGCGMDEDTMKRIFEPFFTTKSHCGGTGLGMPSVYQTAEAHGAALTLTSRLGEGTCFRVYFPVAKAEDVAEEKPYGQVKAKILVVDDEALLREVLKEILIQSGAEVVCVTNGREALDIYAAQKDIDVVMLDALMPEMSGKEVYAALKQINPRLKAIFMSGYVHDEDIESLLAQNPLSTAFVGKPYTPEEVIKSLLALLATEQDS